MVARRPGLRSVISTQSFDETVAALTAAIEASPTNLVFSLDHSANAASAGLDLHPTTLLVFGNPNLGTPLMQRRRTLAIDLAQKFLVHETVDGDVVISWNDPFFLARRHRLPDERAVLDTIAGALQAPATTAAGG